MADIKFWGLKKVNKLPNKKEQNFTALKNESEIAAENGMWLTHPSHLNINKKRIVTEY